MKEGALNKSVQCEEFECSGLRQPSTTCAMSMDCVCQAVFGYAVGWRASSTSTTTLVVTTCHYTYEDEVSTGGRGCYCRRRVNGTIEVE